MLTCLEQSGINFSVNFNPFPDIKVTCHNLIFSWYLGPHECFWYHTFSHRGRYIVNNADFSEPWCAVSVCSADTKQLIGFYCRVWLFQHILGGDVVYLFCLFFFPFFFFTNLFVFFPVQMWSLLHIACWIISLKASWPVKCSCQCGFWIPALCVPHSGCTDCLVNFDPQISW